jgi:hypothetical protein
MIVLRRRGNLWNWLFQYCFARVLAGRFGYRVVALPVLGFPGTFAEARGEEVYGSEARWQGQWPFDAYSGRRLAREELLQAPGQRLTLDGLFQRWELIAEAREEIRGDWLRVDGALPVRASGDFAICVRLGERRTKADGGMENGKDGKDGVKESDGVLTEAEIRRLARTVGHERLYLVTDAPGHPLVAGLRDLRAEVVSLGGMEEFRFIHSFQKVAIGQSTLHWWAAFLGAAREVYFPPCDRGVWGHPEPAHLAHEPGHWGIDLRVDEERYVYDW